MKFGGHGVISGKGELRLQQVADGVALRCRDAIEVESLHPARTVDRTQAGGARRRSI